MANSQALIVPENKRGARGAPGLIHCAELLRLFTGVNRLIKNLLAGGGFRSSGQLGKLNG